MRIATFVALSVFTLGLLAPGAAGAPRRTRGPRALRQLDLSSAQCATLASLAREAECAVQDRARAEARFLPTFHEALLRLREEVRADQGLSPETMRQAGKLSKELKKIHHAQAVQLQAIESRAHACLTPAQRRRARLDPPDAARAAKSKGEAPEVAELKRQLLSLYAARHPRVGRLGRWLTTPGLPEALAARAEGQPFQLRPAPRAADPESKALAAEVRSLRREINLWNLMNGLHLTPAQLETIASAAESRDAEGATDVVLRGLSAEQKAVVLDYKQCLVPPRNLRDPVRAGQAKDTTGPVRLLTRLRRIPERRYAAHRERILRATLEQIEEREGSYSEDERLACWVVLAHTLDRARALDDVAFQLRAEDLARDLQCLFRVTELKERLAQALGAEQVVKTKAEKFLLDAHIAPLCRQRLGQLAISAKIEIEGPLPKAEQCEGGEKCGRP
ncbi:MAG: hypothetical protein ACYTEZ_06615 [Planctomycetota bacterium]|jgi:hypothetical protein